MAAAGVLPAFSERVWAAGGAPGCLDVARLRLFDTLTAALIGARTEDAAVAARLRRASAPPEGVAFDLAFRVRCTEVDDIHLGSCTTPGSVAVPAALGIAAGRPDLDAGRLLAGVVAGYEAVIRMGLAVDGPRVLYRGIWPTYVAAWLGAAASAGRVLGLTARQGSHALALAALAATGTSGGTPGGRWFSLAGAVQLGVQAALAAEAGASGDLALLDERWSACTGISVDPEALVAPGDPAIEAVSSKPYCAARQVTAAVHAFRLALEEAAVEPDAISAVDVAVPSAYAGMIDRPSVEDRMGSIVSAQYQLALAAHDPEGLLDVVRTGLRRDALAARVRVRADPELDGRYPATWPARVTIRTAGRSWQREVDRVPGDPPDQDWDRAERKARRVLRGHVAERDVAALAEACRSFTRAGELTGILVGLDPSPE